MQRYGRASNFQRREASTNHLFDICLRSRGRFERCVTSPAAMNFPDA